MRWGYHTLRNMIEAGFRHRLYPVHPNDKEVQGIPSYPDITRIPAEVDLAVIVVNTTQVADVITQCIDKKVKGGIVITAGFAEAGAKRGTTSESGRTRCQTGRLLLYRSQLLGNMELGGQRQHPF